MNYDAVTACKIDSAVEKMELGEFDDRTPAELNEAITALAGNPQGDLGIWPRLTEEGRIAQVALRIMLAREQWSRIVGRT